MKTAIYPFAALVGQDTLKLALLLNAVDPVIGGVLISGEKGTAKSTAARALAAVLPPIRRVAGCPFQCGDRFVTGPDNRDLWEECPHCRELSEPSIIETPVPFVDLPLGATEDRVLGTLDFQRALREGQRALHPGLLASAHRGILYIDEVNLLPDHLVDVLLDAAAMGVNTVQRDGVEIQHPSRFILIGTMNPEEGELRPQFLDRFGLMVTVAGSREPEVRSEIVRRRLAYETDAVVFSQRWSAEQDDLRRRIVQARHVLGQVEHDDGLLSFISQLCCELHVDGLRADIVLLRTARALAAWHARARVAMEDIRAAAELVLPHRRRRRPFEKPGLDQQRLDELFQQDPASRPRKRPEEPASTQSDSATAPNEKTEIIPPSQPPPFRRIEMATPPNVPANHGRRNAVRTEGRGAYVRAVADPTAGDIALDATIRAAILRSNPQSAIRNPQFPVEVLPEDVHRKERSGRIGTLLLFVVDSSGSMAARRRIEAVKGAVLGLLQSAYEERDQVAVLAFRGPQAELLLPPTRSIEAAESALRSLPTGGRTPLAHALTAARELVEKTGRSQPGVPILLIVLTDGKANVCLPGVVGDPWQQALTAAAALAETAALMCDIETGVARSGRPQILANAMGAECLRLEDLSAENLLLMVREQSRQLMAP